MTGVELIAQEAERMIADGEKQTPVVLKRSFFDRFFRSKITDKERLAILIHAGADIALAIDRLQAEQKEE